MWSIVFFLIFAVVFSCVEPYEFVIRDETPLLVVEGFISDQSFAETRGYPSDGRYFQIKLTLTGDVRNARPEPVRNATVSLLKDDGSTLLYEEIPGSPGVYAILSPDFAALPGLKYRLEIDHEGEIFESSWEELPSNEVMSIGSIDFVESTRDAYVYEAGEAVIRSKREVIARIFLDHRSSSSPIYYRWDFTPTWLYIAPLSPSSIRPGYKCWVTSNDYLNSYALQIDHAGGYFKDLFSIETEANERIWDNLSVLINQFAISEAEYFFWKEMKDQAEGSGIIDNPPYNLQSNITARSGIRVIGYFGVVREQAARIYFNKDQLSYRVENAWKKGCETIFGPPLPGCPEPLPSFPACECKYCLDYQKGIPTNQRPEWWLD